jgi:hypothetical protein
VCRDSKSTILTHLAYWQKMTAAQTKKITAALKSNASISGGKAITITQEVRLIHVRDIGTIKFEDSLL